MKKHIVIAALLAFVVVGALTSCKKKGCTDELATNYDEKAKKDDDLCLYPDPEKIDTTNNNTSDTELPSIEIVKPYDGQMYMIDSLGILKMAVPIQANISDNDELKSVEMELYYTNNDTTVMHFSKQLNSTSFSLDTTYMNSTMLYPTVMQGQFHDVIITAEDISGNIKKDTVSFFIHYMG